MLSHRVMLGTPVQLAFRGEVAGCVLPPELSVARQRPRNRDAGILSADGVLGRRRHRARVLIGWLALLVVMGVGGGAHVRTQQLAAVAGLDDPPVQPER